MTKRLLIILALLALTSTVLAADNLSFSIITSTGQVPVTGMVSYQLAERGELSAWADVFYLGEDDSLALGISARPNALSNLLPLVQGGGVCGYWRFQHECLKGRLYLINISF